MLPSPSQLQCIYPLCRYHQPSAVRLRQHKREQAHRVCMRQELQCVTDQGLRKGADLRVRLHSSRVRTFVSQKL